MKEEKKVIMYDSPEAAKEVTLTGWLSADGRFYGKNEHMARWGGCTHNVCECGSVKEKHYTRCNSCIQKARAKTYNELPFEEWDYEKPVVTWDGDDYFYDIEALEEYMEESDIDEINLLICSPIYHCQIDADQVTNGEAHENYEMPDELAKKIDELNNYIRTLPPHSYTPGKIRTTYKRKQPAP